MTETHSPLPPAGWGRRIAALLIDWFSSTAVGIVLLGGVANWQATPWSGFVTLGVFFVQVSLGTALAAGSFGQLALGLRVLRTTGGTVGLLQSMLRTLLICLAVPPLIFKPDGRGLHDLAVGSGCYRVG